MASQYTKMIYTAGVRTIIYSSSGYHRRKLHHCRACNVRCRRQGDRLLCIGIITRSQPQQCSPSLWHNTMYHVHVVLHLWPIEREAGSNRTVVVTPGIRAVCPVSLCPVSILQYDKDSGS